MPPLLFDLGAHPRLLHGLTEGLGAEPGLLCRRSFPDGEHYLRVDTPPEGRDVVLICSMGRADTTALNVLFAAATMRDLGARRVGLVAPYLAYMRQDARFHAGEGITSRYYAAMLGDRVDWLVTVDPHLHRYRSLGEIYPVPALAVPSAGCMAAWLRERVADPVLVGPDAESGQWVSRVAAALDAPWTVMEKQRSGDRDVRVAGGGLALCREGTPVLLDDIVSTGRTMIAALQRLQEHGTPVALCMAVHGLFADDAWDALQRAGAGTVVTSNTVEHPSNAVDVTEPLLDGARRMLAP